jgi:hypothetical protein
MSDKIHNERIMPTKKGAIFSACIGVEILFSANWYKFYPTA